MRFARKMLPVLMSMALVAGLCPGMAFASLGNANHVSGDTGISETENKPEVPVQNEDDRALKAAASSFATTDIILGKTYTGRTKDHYDSVYKFVVPKTSVLHLRGKGDGFSLWKLLDSNGTDAINEHWSEFNSVLNEAPISDNWYVNPGTYYFKVSKSTYTYTNYSFSVTADPINVSFVEEQPGSDNNLRTANAISLGKSYTGQIARGKFTNPKSNYDVDFYKLTLASATRIGLTASSQTVGLECTVYNANGDKVDSARTLKNKTTGNADITLNVNVPKGASYIAIEPANSYGYDCEAARRESQGLYTFTVKDLNQSKPSTNTSSSNAAQPVQMHRLYNPNSGEHFYTASEVERDHLKNVGWDYEGVGWTAPKSSNTPVYRLYNANAGDHHYTTSAVERDHLVSVGWSDEGTGWYSDDSKRVALYRQYNPNAIAGSHNYTTSGVERDHLVGVGWNDEGIGWYGIS